MRRVIGDTGIAPALVEDPELALLVQAHGERDVAEDHVEGGSRDGRRGGPRPR